MIKTQIAQLLEEEMDRKDFLKHVGIAAVALTGITAALQIFAKNPSLSSRQQSQGYGALAYGGKRKNTL